MERPSDGRGETREPSCPWRTTANAFRSPNSKVSPPILAGSSRPQGRRQSRSRYRLFPLSSGRIAPAPQTSKRGVPQLVQPLGTSHARRSWPPSVLRCAGAGPASVSGSPVHVVLGAGLSWRGSTPERDSRPTGDRYELGTSQAVLESGGSTRARDLRCGHRGAVRRLTCVGRVRCASGANTETVEARVIGARDIIR
jgi:hypothetical protein